MGGSFTTQQTTTESFSNISGDLRLLRTSADFIADGGVTGTSFSGAGTGLTGTASSLSIGGNAATATNLTTNRTNWSTNGTITAVVGQLSWKNYSNGHTIFDASNATAPDGTAINNTNPSVAWTGTYPTLMGWNGSSTYGVRVDSSRYADQVGYSPNRTDSTAYAVLWGAGSTNTIAYSCAAVTIQSSTGTLTATSFSGAGTGLTGTASSLSIGGNAVTAGGLAVHGGRNNEANKIVRTDSNGYIQAGWINTTSGDMADTQSINKIYCSDDDYVRYKGVADFKQQIGLTYKNSTPRSTSTTDTNYWTGMMGWGTTDFNTMITWGCGFIDSWASPGNSPGAGYTHFVGVQALHYTNGDTDGTDNYGYQLVAGSGVNSPLFLRVNWGSAGSWKTMLDSLNFNSYSPSLTGNGASGNWAINVTGNAATVTNGIYTTNYYAGLPLGKRRYRIHSADSTSLNSSITNAECGFTYGGSGEPTGPYIAFGGLGGSIDYSCQLVGAYSGGGNDFKIRTRNDDAASWNTWRTIVTDGNYTSYSPTLTGTGASGTWGINITGNAATATTATNVTIANGSVTLAKIENITAYTILGNSNASAAATPAALSVATVATMLSGQTMNINGSSTSCSGNAATATLATKASTLSQGGGNGTGMTFNWSGQGGQPTWLWGSNDGTNIYVWNPSNFNVNYATSAGSATSATTAGSCSGNAATATNVAASGITGQTGMWTSATRPGPYRLYRNDDNSAYNVQLTWQAHRTNYWSLRGYLNDGFHAECFVVYSGYADSAGSAGALTTGNTYQVASLGISVAASNRLHVNGDGTNPAIRVDNGAVVLAASAASNSKTFYGWLPISIAGTTKWIQMYN